MKRQIQHRRPGTDRRVQVPPARAPARRSRSRGLYRGALAALQPRTGRKVPEIGIDESADIVAEETAFRREFLDTDGNDGWIAVPAETDPDTPLEMLRESFRGFLLVSVDESPAVFDHPNRLVVSDLYVVPDCRGTDLAVQFMERARTTAEAAGCSELRLDVDVPNERARAFYEKLGFEAYRHRLKVSVDSLDL
ncbi:MAG: GNAT family N-acetyltransferase [Halobacteriaceae archaeon]